MTACSSGLRAARVGGALLLAAVVDSGVSPLTLASVRRDPDPKSARK
jgi:hypothetical protein